MSGAPRVAGSKGKGGGVVVKMGRGKPGGAAPGPVHIPVVRGSRQATNPPPTAAQKKEMQQEAGGFMAGIKRNILGQQRSTELNDLQIMVDKKAALKQETSGSKRAMEMSMHAQDPAKQQKIGRASAKPKLDFEEVGSGPKDRSFPQSDMNGSSGGNREEALEVEDDQTSSSYNKNLLARVRNAGAAVNAGRPRNQGSLGTRKKEPREGGQGSAFADFSVPDKPWGAHAEQQRKLSFPTSNSPFADRTKTERPRALEKENVPAQPVQTALQKLHAGGEQRGGSGGAQPQGGSANKGSVVRRYGNSFAGTPSRKSGGGGGGFATGAFYGGGSSQKAQPHWRPPAKNAASRDSAEFLRGRDSSEIDLTGMSDDEAPKKREDIRNIFKASPKEAAPSRQDLIDLTGSSSTGVDAKDLQVVHDVEVIELDGSKRDEKDYCHFILEQWVGKVKDIRLQVTSSDTKEEGDGSAEEGDEPSRKKKKKKMQMAVDKVVSTLSTHGLGNFSLTAGTLKCLNGPEWLNDEVINAYMGLLSLRAKLVEADEEEDAALLLHLAETEKEEEEALALALETEAASQADGGGVEGKVEG
ncbi:hypothetical protein T484DRAFT_1892646, partial [Baffinella frigidus]